MVTEYVESGTSLLQITEILEAVNIKFDIAVLSATRARAGLKKVKDAIQGRHSLIFGEGSGAGNLYGMSNLSGVIKDKPGSPFPQKYRQPLVQGSINQARQDISLLAENTLKMLGEHTQLSPCLTPPKFAIIKVQNVTPDYPQKQCFPGSLFS